MIFSRRITSRTHRKDPSFVLCLKKFWITALIRQSTALINSTQQSSKSAHHTWFTSSIRILNLRFNVSTLSLERLLSSNIPVAVCMKFWHVCTITLHFQRKASSNGAMITQKMSKKEKVWSSQGERCWTEVSKFYFAFRRGPQVLPTVRPIPHQGKRRRINRRWELIENAITRRMSLRRRWLHLARLTIVVI